MEVVGDVLFWNCKESEYTRWLELGLGEIAATVAGIPIENSHIGLAYPWLRQDIF